MEKRLKEGKIALYPHQKKAVEQMRNGCILCGEYGSGKSRTALAYYYVRNGGDLSSPFLWMKEDCEDLYIITTARKRDTYEWDAEMTEFLLSRDSDKCRYRNKVVVDSWNNIGKYADVTGAFFIFDEQRVTGKGPWVKSFLRIAKANEWILLSATPGDTWSDYIPVFLANGFYKNRTQFAREHIVYSRYITKYPKVDRYVNERKLLKLRDYLLIDMDFLRGTHEHHETVYSLYDKEKYREAGRTRWNPYKNQPMVNAAELCSVWRRIVNEDLSKRSELLDIFMEHPKVIIFYNFNYELDILRSIDWGKASVAEWNGHKHEPIPESDSWVYFVQYTSGCEGWNCTKTDTMIFFSENYSYKVMTQACGRINRMNTPYKDLYYYHLVSKAPIDTAIRRALSEKRDFNERRFVKW